MTKKDINQVMVELEDSIVALIEEKEKQYNKEHKGDEVDFVDYMDDSFFYHMWSNVYKRRENK